MYQITVLQLYNIGHFYLPLIWYSTAVVFAGFQSILILHFHGKPQKIHLIVDFLIACGIVTVIEMKKINTNQPVLNNHTLAEFLENPTKVIEDSPSYRYMATYAEEKKNELDKLKKQMGDYENNECKIQDKIYFLKTSKTGSTSVANILTRFGLRK